MKYVIQNQIDKFYANYKGKIILFNAPDEAQHIFNKYQQALQVTAQKMANEGDPFAIFEVPEFLHGWQIIEQDFKETPPCGVINIGEIDF